MQVVLLAWALALLVLASALVLIALRREYIKAQQRRSYRSQLARDLARDRNVHDKLSQMPLPEEADDYINAIYPEFDPEAPTQGPWKHFHRVSPMRTVTSREVQASSETGFRDARAYQ